MQTRELFVEFSSLAYGFYEIHKLGRILEKNLWRWHSLRLGEVAELRKEDLLLKLIRMPWNSVEFENARFLWQTFGSTNLKKIASNLTSNPLNLVHLLLTHRDNCERSWNGVLKDDDFAVRFVCKLPWKSQELRQIFPIIQRLQWTKWSGLWAIGPMATILLRIHSRYSRWRGLTQGAKSNMSGCRTRVKALRSSFIV